MQPITFYVSPYGNDRWSGTRAVPNRQKTDGPFATLERAQKAVRQLKRQQRGLRQPVVVFVRGGTYFLRKPLTFTPEDSGTAECPVTFAAYKDEKPVISGGRRLGSWKIGKLGNGQTVRTMAIPAVRRGKWFFRQLWVNGERRVRARHPNRGYLRVAEVEMTPEWHEGQRQFRFNEGDLTSSHPSSASRGNIAACLLAQERLGDVVVMTRWVESRLPVIGVDEKERRLTFGKRSVFRLESGDPYYVEHCLAALDAPGEWYLDKKRGTLYYAPLPNENLRRAEVIAPVLMQVVRLEGKPEAGQFVEHLIFRGLTFAHTEWYFPENFAAPWPQPDVGGFSQAAVGVPGAVYGEGVRRCTFDGCTFKNLGTYAIELARGCQNNCITGCEMFDLGAGGVKIGETILRGQTAAEVYGDALVDATVAQQVVAYSEEQTHDNQVTDCHIHHGGRMFHSAVGVWIGQSYNNLLAHNHIHDFYYTGISVGWTWGYGPTLARGNVVEFNHVHHIGVLSDGDGPILSDMGGIYTLGMQPGTLIRHNVFHDIAGLRYGGWGIYFDEGSAFITASHNLVYRTTHGGFHQHYGKDNVVTNNIFAFGRDQQIQRSRSEDHRSFFFERNIVIWNEGKLLTGNLDNLNVSFDNNVYHCTGKGETTCGRMTWEEWRDKGMDVHSVLADAKCVNPKKNDFRLKRTSPAFALGFVAFDVTQVGPRDGARRDK
ncbi:MAG: right-handed parallel beta-helix repeat-containing protein [Abditibacteriales bacterium]|nr:right-handed parallel beta-helix repeat-containing protein [Abditibacteriales bacterium]MDW8367491.1 right-handed parallel beta-helix repeat-containing protein [Abditibacteriales bacterium]